LGANFFGRQQLQVGTACCSFMTPPSFSDKDGLVDLQVPAPSEQPSSKSAYLNAISPLTNAWNRYSEWRTSFDLPNPGSTENLQKEVKGVFLVTYENTTRF
jgi:mitochondrial import receptor subunit TOM40